MRKALAVLLASTIIFAPTHSYAGPIKKLLVGASAGAAATYALKAKDKSSIEKMERLIDMHRPFLEAVEAGQATHKQYKSYQDDFVKLGAAAYTTYVFKICATEDLERCSAALQLGYIGTNLYFGEGDTLTRAFCSVASSMNTAFIAALQYNLEMRINDLSINEFYSDAGIELRRQYERIKAEVDKVADAGLRSRSGELVQPGCKYPLQY